MPAHHPAQGPQVPLPHAEAGEAPGCRLGVEDPNHRLLASVDGEGADPERERATVVGEVDATVLRPPPHRDVHPGGHLDARKHCPPGRGGQIDALSQETVDSDADPHVRAGLLDVDVARAAVDGVAQYPVDEPDDGGSPRGRLQPVGRDGLLLAQLVGERLHEVREVRPAVRLDPLRDRFGRGHDGPDSAAGLELEVVDGGEVQGVGHGDRQRAIVDRERKDAVRADERPADDPHGGGIGVEGAGPVG